MKRSSRAGRLTQLERNQRTTGIFFILPSLVLCAIFMVVPLINVIRYSLTDWDGLSKTYNFVGLYNYMHLHEIEGFGEMMLATVTFAIGVTAITIIVSFLAALALDKRGRDRLPRGLMRALWFFPALLSGAVVGILWRIMYNYNNGVINKIITSAGLPAVNWLETRGVTNIAIIIGAAWVQIGLCVVVFLAGLQSIPQEMYEAAMVDGASRLQRLWHITVPSIRMTIAIMLTLQVGNLFAANVEKVLLLQNDLNLSVSELLPTFVYKQGLVNGKYSYATAAGLFTSVVSCLLVVLANWGAKKISSSEMGVF